MGKLLLRKVNFTTNFTTLSKMKASYVALALSALTAVSAVPLNARNNGGGKKEDYSKDHGDMKKGGNSDNNGGMSNIDVTILQYALTLEHLENTFYSQALAQYDANAFTSAGFDSSVRDRIATIGSDEQSHVDFLSTALSAAGVEPTQACSYDFGYNDVASFLATASILEGVGVSAYLGAAAKITSDDYLTAAGSILTVESRHSAYIRDTVGQSPFPAPYDIPLGFNQVFSLASLFITSCPESNPALPVMAFPGLTAQVQGDSVPGGMVKLVPTDAKTLQGTGQLYAAFVGFPSTAYGAYNKETMTVTIPKDAAGQTYVVLTSSKDMVTDDNTVAGVGILNVSA